MSKRHLVYIIVPIIGSCWGLSFLATDVLLDYIDPIQIQAMRWLVASVVFAVMIAMGRLHISFKRPTAKYLLLAGLAQPVMYMIFENYGIRFTSPSVSAIFIATIPSMALIIRTVFLKKRTSGMGVFSILLAFSGVVISTVFSPAFSIGGRVAGYMCLIGAVIGGALYTTFSPMASEDYEPLEITAVMAFEGLVAFTILNFALGYGTTTYVAVATDKKMLLCVMFLGIFCSAICFAGLNKVLAIIDPAIGNNLSASTSTIVGAVAGILIGGDPGGIYTVVGLGMTLTGVYISTRQIEN